jgi:hypothetical protein
MGPSGGWVPTRQPPRMPVQAYQTYAAFRPLSTHSRRATCAEVDCQANLKGWQTVIDTGTDLGRRQANYIRLKSGRAFQVTQDGDKVTFTFPPGQRCFADHRINLDKPTIYLKRGGDWRAETFPAQRMQEADWVDDFANHQQDLADKRQQG